MISRQNAIQKLEWLGFLFFDTIFMRSNPPFLRMITFPRRMHLHMVSIIQCTFFGNGNLKSNLLSRNQSTRKALQKISFQGLPELDFPCIDLGTNYSLMFLYHSFFLKLQSVRYNPVICGSSINGDYMFHQPCWWGYTNHNTFSTSASHGVTMIKTWPTNTQSVWQTHIGVSLCW